MYRNILEQMQECVWQRRVVIPTHAFVAMTQDLFTPEDLYHCILQGEIVERQWDRNYGKYKFVLDGEPKTEARCNWLLSSIKLPVILTSSRFTACIDMITKTKTHKPKQRLDQTPRSICVHCGEEAARSVTLPQAYQQGNDLILIENVPMKLCESCGQSYLEGVTLDEISKVLKAPAQYTEPQLVKVARLP